MIAAILFAAQTLPPHPRELPITPVEWLDHYDYCLHVNAAALIEGKVVRTHMEAARRAVVRCWPVRASARRKIISQLRTEGRHNDGNNSQEIAERLLNNAAKAFAQDFSIRLSELGPLDPR
ncbi:MAG: hypothetical protein EOP50_18830 [Sphingobacteriales bacterium]|nr:MAG: hypothetical protein EOP50_18830 [Sphingobacteriales bacterium]